MRPIDADELVKDIDELSKDAGFYRPIYEGFKNCVNSKQTIDAVPVVRCRECKHRGTDDCIFHIKGEPADEELLLKLDNDFCSYGERKGCAD